MNPDGSLAGLADRWGINPEIITAVVVMVAPTLVSPLGAVWKRWRKTSGPDTRAVIKLLTAALVGVGGFAVGLYGYDVRGMVNAVGAAILAYLKTTGDYERDVNVQRKANRLDASTDGPADVPASDPLAGWEPAPLDALPVTGNWGRP